MVVETEPEPEPEIAAPKLEPLIFPYAGEPPEMSTPYKRILLADIDVISSNSVTFLYAIISPTPMNINIE